MDAVRVISRGQNGVGGKIAPVTDNIDPQRFKAEVMAHLRSVEQQYWNLAQAHVQLWSSDRAVSLAQEILNREQADLALNRGNPASVAEAAQRLEQLNLDLVTRTSDVATTEQQFPIFSAYPGRMTARSYP